MMPFGFGSRSCPGRSMALSNVMLTIAHTIWQYDIRKADGDMGQVGKRSFVPPKRRVQENEFRLRSTVTSMSEGPYLSFHERRK